MGASVHTQRPGSWQTALTKYKITLTDQMPFKKHYRCIPPHMYDDMRAHIQEMLDIGAIY